MTRRDERKRGAALVTPDRNMLDEASESPTVEVRVRRDDELIHRQLCETAEDAAAIVSYWSEIEGVRCEVDDLAVRHRPDQILEPGPDDPFADPDVARAPREPGG